MKTALRDPRFMGVIVAAVGAAVYANSLLNGFALDDNFIVLGNPRVRGPINLADIWLTPYWPFAGVELGLYRPAIIFLFAVEWAVGGGQPWVFHAVNVALHAAASVLVFVLLLRLVDNTAALVGALIFAVHPLHTEAVANIVGQSELVAAVAVLGACVIHSGRDELQVAWWRRIAMTVLFALALTTKESSVVLPALLVLVDFAQRRVQLTVRGVAEYAENMLMPIFLLAATLGLYLLVRYDALGGALTGLDAAPSMPYLREEYRVLNALRVFPEFIRLLFLPIDLAADYSPAAILPVESVRPMVMLGALLLGAIAVLSMLTPWFPYAGFPAAWFLVSIITVSNLFFPIGVLIAERTLYLPSVAVSALAAFLWQVGAGRVVSPAMRRTVLVLVPFVIIGMGIRTWIRNPVWAGTETVWMSMLRDQPQSYRTQWLYAIHLWSQGRIDEAAARFEFAYRLYPRDAQVLAEYGNLMIAQGRFDEAVQMLETAHEMHPWVARTTLILMRAYLATGRYEDAIRTAELARRTGASASVTLPVRAFGHQQLGQLPEAIAAWRVAIAHSPAGAWPLHGYLARVLATTHREGAALARLDSARTALADSAAIAGLASVEQAVRAGCYRHRGDAQLPDSLPLAPERPLGAECDLLGHPFDFVQQRQNANVSQNAIPVGPAGTESRSDDLP